MPCWDGGSAQQPEDERHGEQAWWAEYDAVADRFWPKVQRGEGCWEWQGFKIRGYGGIALKAAWRGVRAGTTRAHRVSWALHYGEIPPGLYVCHRCDNPGCVRPEHLFLGTSDDNNKDRAAKGRTISPQVYKTHCPSGHEYNQGNTYRGPKGDRRCRECARESDRRRGWRRGVQRVA